MQQISRMNVSVMTELSEDVEIKLKTAQFGQVISRKEICMKTPTVALVVRSIEGAPQLVDILCDDGEIALLELAILENREDPLDAVYDHRKQTQKEESEFADYVEDLLSQPFLRPEIQEHGIQWLKSKLRIEEYQQSEVDAARVIAAYAFQIFAQEPQKTDFFLAGPRTQVRIRVFDLGALTDEPVANAA